MRSNPNAGLAWLLMEVLATSTIKKQDSKHFNSFHSGEGTPVREGLKQPSLPVLLLNNEGKKVNTKIPKTKEGNNK